MRFFSAEIKILKYRIPLAAVLWFTLALTAIVVQLSKESFNNFLIFKGVFHHTISQLPLYANYPQEYGDSNHYGPLFSVIILPFALMPTFLGVLIWGLANAAFLFYAIQALPLSQRSKNVVILISAIEMMTAMHNLQFNIMLTAWLLFA